MSINNPQEKWQHYCQKELATVRPILEKHGFQLDQVQPHIAGERFLMQALTTSSGRKLILLGAKKADSTRVVIKATSDKNGKQEIAHERTCRQALHAINFAYDVFHSPKEVLHLEEGGMTVSIQEFIEQEKPFLDRPQPEQFSLALRAFKAQEGVRATTKGHFSSIHNIFAHYQTDDYLKNFAAFIEQTGTNVPTRTTELLQAAYDRLKSEQKSIAQYGDFLTHTDFVPHNLRIRGKAIFLLDFSALRFGNKHEGWARFLNFMALHNPELEQAFLKYFRENRAPEELASLELMRLYRLGEIICYYYGTLENSTGDLLKLNTTRIDFWTDVLEAMLQNRTINDEQRQTYVHTRDSLRSAEEKKRQEGLH